jgi:hypothetical protein
MLKKKARANRVPSLFDRVLAEAEVTLICEPEDVSYVGNCSAIDPETDHEQEQWIADQLDSGNEWAWCSVEVRLEWHGLSVSEYLGCCSYESRATFIASGYYQDMVRTCAREISYQAQAIAMEGVASS